MTDLTIDQLLAEIAFQRSIQQNFDRDSLEWQAVDELIADLYRQLAEAVGVSRD